MDPQHRQPILDAELITNVDQTTLVLLGDSLTAANDAEQRNIGYFTWVNALLQGRFRVINYAGVGGQTTTQIKARVASDVIAYNPQWCIVMGGANDIASDVDADVAFGNLTDICDDLVAAGIKVILSTVTPSTSYNTSQRKAEYASLNAQIAGYAATDVTIVDMGSSYQDPGDTSQPISGATYDGVHPSALGAYLMAANLVIDFDGSAIALPTLFADNHDADLLHVNPMMTGTAGTKSGSITGTVATGWTASGDGAASLIERYPYGYWQQIVLNATQVSLQAGDITTGWSVGDNVVAQCEIETEDDWSGVTIFELFFEMRDGSSRKALRGALNTHPNSGTDIRNPGSCILRSDVTTIPTGTTLLRPYVLLIGNAGTIKIGRFEIKKV
jgi:lysophospholipase L1-like esterase